MNGQNVVVRGSHVSLEAASIDVKRAARIILFVLFTAIGAQLAIRLPFTPVPVTMQTLFAVLAGITLGPRDGFYAMLSYLAIGVAGAPVFAHFGFGPGVLFGVTGGYLIAFPVAALCAGIVTERFGGGRMSVAFGALSGLVIILVSGTLYLSVVTGMNIVGSARLGLYPFVGGEAIKIVIVIILVKKR